MKVKTSELKGAALDWAVAKCEGYRVRRNPFSGTVYDNFKHFYWVDDYDGEEVIRDLGWIRPGYQSDYSPSTDWSQGGLIIERERITVYYDNPDNTWVAWPAADMNATRAESGATPLIAAMRCYVASKLGNMAEIPDELIGKE